jgi:hypothetical protein
VIEMTAIMLFRLCTPSQSLGERACFGVHAPSGQGLAHRAEK